MLYYEMKTRIILYPPECTAHTRRRQAARDACVGVTVSNHTPDVARGGAPAPAAADLRRVARRELRGQVHRHRLFGLH